MLGVAAGRATGHYVTFAREGESVEEHRRTIIARRAAPSIWVAICALVLPSCSFTFAKGPPQRHAHKVYFDCPSTAAMPATDGLFAALFSLSAITAATDEENGSRGAAVGVPAGIAAALMASTVYGILKTRSCRAAKRQLEERLYRAAEGSGGRAAGPATPPRGAASR
jgi:hypothetical protein